MITFLVVGDFITNAQLLDWTRLGKQRVEAMQIINIIEKLQSCSANKITYGNHPIVKAWMGHIDALKYYCNCIILEWIKRGGNNTMSLYTVPDNFTYPWWTEWDKLHQSHRAMLMRKNPFYYERKFMVDEEYYRYGYIWPSSTESDRERPLLELASNIPKELVNPKYCGSILKTGKRKGESCNRIIKNINNDVCKIHLRDFENKKIYK